MASTGIDFKKLEVQRLASIVRLSQPVQAPWITSWLTEAHSIYGKTKNPLFVFEAYEVARRFRHPIPEWVLEAFDAMGRRLRESRDDSESRVHWATRVAVSMGFPARARGGPGLNPFTGAAREFYLISLAVRVRVLVDSEEVQGEDKACGVVAADQGVSKAAVREAWTTYHDLVRSGDVAEQQFAVTRPLPKPKSFATRSRKPNQRQQNRRRRTR